MNLLLLDARDPFGGGRLARPGRLREPIAAARRADAFVFTRVDRAAPPQEAVRVLQSIRPEAPIFHARIRPPDLRDENGAPLDAARVRRPAAHRGLRRGQPAEFAATLSELGLRPEERLDFRDHQRYGERQLARIRTRPNAPARAWS